MSDPRILRSDYLVWLALNVSCGRSVGIVSCSDGRQMEPKSDFAFLPFEVAPNTSSIAKTDRRYVSVVVPLATLLFVAACFQYPTVKRCRTWVGRSSSSII